MIPSLQPTGIMEWLLPAAFPRMNAWRNCLERQQGPQKERGVPCISFPRKRSFLADMESWETRYHWVPVLLFQRNTTILEMFAPVFSETVLHGREPCTRPLTWLCSGNCR